VTNASLDGTERRAQVSALVGPAWCAMGTGRATMVWRGMGHVCAKLRGLPSLTALPVLITLAPTAFRRAPVTRTALCAGCSASAATAPLALDCAVALTQSTV